MIINKCGTGRKGGEEQVDGEQKNSLAPSSSHVRLKKWGGGGWWVEEHCSPVC